MSQATPVVRRRVMFEHGVVSLRVRRIAVASGGERCDGEVVGIAQQRGGPASLAGGQGRAREGERSDPRARQLREATPMTLRDRTPVLLLVAAASAALVAAGCDDRKPKPGGDTPDAGAAASPTPTSDPVNAKLGCVPAARGGHTLLASTGAATIAAAGGSALLVTWRKTPTSVLAERVALGSDARLAGPIVPFAVTDAGAPRMTWAAAGAVQSRPAAIAYSVGRADDTTCADASLTIVTDDGATPPFVADVCKAPTAFAAAVRDDLGLALLDGTTPGAKPPKPAGLDAVVVADGKTKTVRLDEVAPPGARGPDAGPSGGAGASAAVAAAAGASWVAAAWVVDAGGAYELRVAGLDRAGDRTAPKSLPIDKGVIGAPALAFEGDVLHVVWSARESGGAPARLRWTKWDGKGASAPPQTLATGSAPAAAPALVVGPGGRFAIAWEEGTEGSTVVKAGASRVNILKAVLAAATVSSPRVKGHAPAVAVVADKASVVWQENGSAVAEMHATHLTCME